MTDASAFESLDDLWSQVVGDSDEPSAPDVASSASESGDEPEPEPAVDGPDSGGGGGDFTPTRLRGAQPKQETIKGHPLASARNYVRVHRVAAFEAWDVGPIPCRVCGEPAYWLRQATGCPMVPIELRVGFADGNRENTEASNLVPLHASCWPRFHPKR